MDVILEWLTKYSPPVVAIIILGAAFLFLIKLVTEKAIDSRFSQYEKKTTLRLERRSRFEEMLLLDQYTLVKELFHKLVRVESDLKRYRSESIVIEGLFLGKDVVPLTQVYEELNSKRYLLGSEFHELLKRHYELLLEIANCKTDQDYKKILPMYESHINDFNRVATQQFGIDRISHE